MQASKMNQATFNYNCARSLILEKIITDRKNPKLDQMNNLLPC